MQGFDVVTRYRPSFDTVSISGDWLDVVDAGERSAFVIGDVAGHGVEAAVAMTRIRSAVEVALASGMALIEVMSGLNETCLQHGLFSTMLLVRPTPSCFEIVSAGHLPPIVRRSSGTEVMDLSPGPALGSIRGARYSPSELAREDVELLALFTDGLAERRGAAIDLGLEAMREAVASGSRDLGELADQLLESEQDQSISDDVALMLIAQPSPSAEAT